MRYGRFIFVGVLAIFSLNAQEVTAGIYGTVQDSNNWDMSLYKTFRLQERASLQFRADAFNPWNHTEFSSVGTSFTTPSTFGKIIAAKNARNLMLGLRLTF